MVRDYLITAGLAFLVGWAVGLSLGLSLWHKMKELISDVQAWVPSMRKKKMHDWVEPDLDEYVNREPPRRAG